MAAILRGVPIAYAKWDMNRHMTEVGSAAREGSGFTLPDDLRSLTPLIYAHVTPYGTFRLDMNQRLAIEQDAIAA